MEVSVKGGRLIVSIPLDEKGQPSASGKTTVHATTRGNVNTGQTVNGKALILGLNAYTK